MENQPDEPEATSTLQWLEAAIGAEAFTYLFNSDPAEIVSLATDQAAQLSEAQKEIVGVLAALRRNMPTELDEESANEALRGWLMQVDRNTGRTIAAHMHEHVLGRGEVPAGADELERAIVALALDVYAGFLFPRDPRLPSMIPTTSIHVVRAAFQHPASESFEAAVLKDSSMAPIFAVEIEHSGRIASMWANTGTGGGLQLSMLTDMLLNRAWRQMAVATRSPAAFAQQVLAELRLSRALMAGESRAIPARIAFAGVLLPADARLELDCGVIRAATDADRELAPDSLKGELHHTGEDGVSTIINYDGDVILDYKFPFRVRVTAHKEGLSSPFPNDMRRPTSLASDVTRLRFALMLAVERPSRVHLVQTWMSIDAPLGYPTMSWSDPRQGTGLAPTQLTDDEVNAWGEWYGRLNTAHVARIELALSRILRAIAERREPSDVLIDSVIAWENLFGTKEGEPTFRVTTCLAILLEKDLDARVELRKKLASIYGLRSKVVHGSGNLKESEYPMCSEAMDIAIWAIRTLVSDRTDILELPDGAVRSSRLLLGG